MKANDEKAGGAEAKFQKAKQKRLIYHDSEPSSECRQHLVLKRV